MGELLSENEQLTVRNFQIPRGCCWRGTVSLRRFGLGPDQLDPDGSTFLQFNLSDGDCSICAIEYALNQTALRVAGTVCKLWHRRGKLIGNRGSQTEIWFRQVESLKVTKLKGRFQGRDVLTNHESDCFSLITVIAKKFTCHAA
jgi:hypothetical protein